MDMTLSRILGRPQVLEVLENPDSLDSWRVDARSQHWRMHCGLH